MASNISAMDMGMEFLFMTDLPAGSDSERGVDALGGVQRPIIDHFRVLLLRPEQLPVHVQLHVREANIYGVMMPLIVANLNEHTKFAIQNKRN